MVLDCTNVRKFPSLLGLVSQTFYVLTLRFPEDMLECSQNDNYVEKSILKRQNLI